MSLIPKSSFPLSAKILFFILFLSTSQKWSSIGINTADAEAILRYTQESCSTLAPSYVEENYSELNLGPDPEPEPEDKDDADKKEDENSEESNIIFETPKKLTTRNPPVEIIVDFDQYRRNREYKVHLIASDFFDSFMIQVRGQDEDGNITHVGKWVDVPGIAAVLKCKKNKLAAVVDKGRPIRLGNLTFHWKAPKSDVGSLRVEASVAYNDAYININSNIIRFNSFPVPVTGCGKTQSCFRVCQFDPRCGSDTTKYMITMRSSDKLKAKEKEESGGVEPGMILFKMGGYLRDETDYIAFGLGMDSGNMRNMDMVACTRRGSSAFMNRYLLENSASLPYEHRERVRLDRFDIDEETGYVWCEFQRPISPESVFDLDLTERMHHFYFWGKLNNQSIPVIPDQKSASLFKSYNKLNISQVYSEVEFGGYSGGSAHGLRGGGGLSTHSFSSFYAVMVVVVVMAWVQKK